MNFIRRNIAIITNALTILAAVMMVFSIYLIFFYAPVEQFMGLPQKIFYFHAPIAMMCYVGFFITFVSSIGYLWTSSLHWDRFAVSGAHTALLFIALTLITGMLWGKPIWGAYWTWDPRLTTSFILWLIYAGYMILRSQVDDEYIRAKYSAVMGIVGFADVPLVHYSVKLWSRGIHPPRPELHPAMLSTFKVTIVTIFILFVVVYIQRVRYEFIKCDVEHLKTVDGQGL